MIQFRWLAATLATIVLGAGTPSYAEEESAPAEPAPATVKPIFKEGEFKCSDGYDPDTDASLHPPGQNPKTRALVNAQAQDKHEKAIVEKGPEKESSSSSSETKKEIESLGEGSREVKSKEEKEKEKEKGEKSKEEKSKEEKSKEEKGKEEKAKAEEAKPKVADSPMQQALFAIQCKNYKGSIDLLKKLLSKDEKNAQAHYLLAVSHVGLRQYSEAKEQYTTVLKLAPTGKLNELASQGLKRVASAP